MDNNIENVNVSLENMSEDQIIKKLLNDEEVPTRTVFLERLGIPIKLRALTAKQLLKTRETATYIEKVKGGEVQKFDNDSFNMGLIMKATVSPNWSDSKLLTSLKVSSGAEILKRKLLAGELDNLANEVMDLSGYNDELKDIKKIKNSSSPDTNLD